MEIVLDDAIFARLAAVPWFTHCGQKPSCEVPLPFVSRKQLTTLFAVRTPAIQGMRKSRHKENLLLICRYITTTCIAIGIELEKRPENESRPI